MQTLRSIKDVITALGGPTVAGHLLGRKQNSVSMWTARGILPASTYLAIKSHLRSQGFDAPDRLWRMNKPHG